MYRLFLRDGTPKRIMTCINNINERHQLTPTTQMDDGGAVPKDKKWYIAIVHTNCEQKVKAYLENMGVETFVPVQTHVRWIGKRKKEVERVVIRSRIFVRCCSDSASRTEVKKVLFVKDFITYPGTYQDAVIPDRQMDQFMYMLGCTDIPVVMSDNIKIGQRVRVARGYFKNVEGNICEIGGKKGTYVGVNMEILGCACVSINLSDLEFLE